MIGLQLISNLEYDTGGRNLKTYDPQLPQKCRETGFPEPPVSLYTLVVPPRETAASGVGRFTANLFPA